MSINTPTQKNSKKQKKRRSGILQKAFSNLPNANKDYDISLINTNSQEKKLSEMKEQTVTSSTNKEKNLKLRERQQNKSCRMIMEQPKKVTKMRILLDSKN